MKTSIRQSLEYVRNTNGGATKANFVEDFDPIGDMLWAEINLQYAFEDASGTIRLTPEGRVALEDKSA